MNNQLNEFIKNQDAEKYATQNGRAIHAKLQFVRITPTPIGAPDLIAKIMAGGAELQSFFTDDARVEVPIAGVIDGRFISRRIDRLVVDGATKTVRVLDYKTDIDTEKYRPKYIAQLREYAELLKQIYPRHKISCYILWLHDWHLEKL